MRSLHHHPCGNISKVTLCLLAVGLPNSDAADRIAFVSVEETDSASGIVSDVADIPHVPVDFYEYLTS